MSGSITRINNNQITTAVGGNAYLGINAAAKLQNYSITSNKIANSLVYGSDLTITGNLTVNGTTTTIDTVNTLIQDPLITLADGQTAGTPTVDIGVIGLRGSENSSFLGWKESQTEFVAALSNTTVSNTTANITSYANFHANTITAAGNLSVVGNIVGSANFTGNVTAGNLLTPGLVSATGTITSSANITGANLLTGGLISASGDISGNNLYGLGEVSTVGNVTGGNIRTVGQVTATGNITGGNILTGGLISAGGNITSATNVNTPNVVGASGLTVSTLSGSINLSPAANIIVNNTYINGVAQPVQSNDVATKIYVDNAVSTQIAYHEPVFVATIANLATTTGGTITYNNGANGVGATITTTGSFNLIDTANVQTANTRILVKNEGNAALNGVYVWSNSTVITRSTDADVYGPNSAEELSINDYFFVTGGNINKGSAYVVNEPTGVIFFGTSNIGFAQFSSSQTYTAGNGISLYGTVISTVYDNATVGVNGSNQLYIPANAPLVTPNIGAATGTSLSVTGNIDAGTTLSSVGNTIAGNVNTAGVVTATGNITGGNILTAGIVSATANITGGNILTAGLISSTGTGTFGNIQVGPDSINDIGTNQTITVNSTNANTNFAVSGGSSNVFFVDASTNTASFGSNLQTSSALVSFNSDTSIKLPVGNTGVRPSGSTGLFRFNTTLNSCEVYNNSEWTPVGGTVFTVVADEQFNGDGSNVAFTLGSTQTTNSCIVSINGIVQVPTSAYSVSGTYPTCVLTFTEAPSVGDLIDVREITTTTTVVSISNPSGNSVLGGSATRAEMTLTGNLIPIGPNVSQSLGNSTNAWSSLYVSGSTIYLGNIELKQGAGNSFAVYQSDGTTPAPLALGNSTISTTGLVTAGNLTVGTGSVTVGNILNSNGNGVGNIGNSTGYFNTVFAKATSAQYADLAEKYIADAEYAPGTVVSFGGEKEVTRSTVDGDRAVAGVVSTNPSYIMNATLDAEHVATIALTGRVPTSVTGTVAKGDLMVSNGDGTARADADPKAGAIIGKALENFDGSTGVIEVVIGRF